VTGVFQILGVDYLQWKAVTRTLLRTDFRLPMSTRASGFGRGADVLTMALVLGMFGLGAAMIVMLNTDVLLTGTIALTYLGVMLATSLMTQHGSTMLSTTDYVILGARPVSSRTFLAIRVTNVLFHALLITALMAYPVVIAYVFAHGVDAGRGIAAALAIFLWSVVVTLMVVTSYGGLLHLVGAPRFQRALGYLQLLGGFLAYGGFFLMTRLFDRPALRDMRLADTPWLLLAPPAWFASYIELAAGVLNSTTWIRMAFSIAAMVVLLTMLRGKLGLEYAGRLGDLPATGHTSSRAAVHTPFFRRGEARAVAVLVMAHFRHDLRVRMGVLAIVPLVFFYTFVGMGESSFDLVALAVLLFPAILSQHFASTDAYQAAWIYSVTPVDRARLVIELKNVAVAYFLLPFLAFVAVVFAVRTGDASHALVHTAILGLVSHLALQGSIMISPRLPFALPPDKTRGNASLMAWLILIILGGQGALLVLDRWVYVSSVRTTAAMAALIVVSWTLNRVITWRVKAIPN
jgi:hypothetical protein